MQQDRQDLINKIAHLTEKLQESESLVNIKSAVIDSLREQNNHLKTAVNKQSILIEKLKSRSLIQRIFNRGKI